MHHQSIILFKVHTFGRKGLDTETMVVLANEWVEWPTALVEARIPTWLLKFMYLGISIQFCPLGD